MLLHDRHGYERGTAITFNRTPRLTRSRAVFTVDLAPHAEWKLCVDVAPIVEGKRHAPLTRCESFGRHVPKMEMGIDEWLEDAPLLDTDRPELNWVCRTSSLDLASLWLRPTPHLKWAAPGGGLPWIMALFGRDGLIASYQALPFHPTLARATLVALGKLQAQERDNYRDAEPGKILHELRRGTLAHLGDVPQTRTSEVTTRRFSS